MKKTICFILLIGSVSGRLSSQPVSQWRGPDRNGVFPETGLLKTWPEDGPELLWSIEDLDKGFSSVSVTDKAVYITGCQDSTEYLTALDLKGRRMWRIPYGMATKLSFPDSRCTPTVDGDRIYLISGRDEVICVDSKRKAIQWKVPAFEKFSGTQWIWGIAESPLIADDKVIYSPGGNRTAMVSLDKKTGETVWQTRSLGDSAAFVSPILVEYNGKNIIVNVTTKTIFGTDTRDGKILWTVPYADIQPPTFHPWAPKNNCITPLYHDGRIYVTSGYDHVGVMLKLLDGGDAVELVWTDPVLDCHHGQVVLVDGFIYGANWLNNDAGNWCCVDWNTGKTMYETKWQNKGSVSAADGMLYCYEEKRGNVALVRATPEGFEPVSSFRIRKGTGPHWAQPVIQNGVLYIRHGSALMAYDIN
ncbi:PQQ-binding-like beta-propeller repeat protein [bacterium]|nr:PQQ-binding-like beta-propeller repeat protein [bacterium]